MKLFAVVLIACLLASGFNPAVASNAPQAAAPTPGSAEAACAELRKLRFKWSDPSSKDRSGMDKLHADLRGPYGGATPGDYFVRILVDGGMTNEGPGGPESTVAWKESGQWYVSTAFSDPMHAHQQSEYAQPPQFPEPAGQVERPGIVGPLDDSSLRVFVGKFDAADADEIEALLFDPCMAREPAELPADLTYKNGHVEPCYPDSARWKLEIQTATGYRSYYRPCHLLGPVGGIIHKLSGLRGDEISGFVPRKTLYAIDENPTFAKLQSYLEARLPGAQFASAPPGITGVITRYRRTSNCGGELEVQTADGKTVTVKRDWNKQTGVEAWPDRTTTQLYFGEVPDRFTFKSTVAALKAEGAAAYLYILCMPSSPAKANP